MVFNVVGMLAKINFHVFSSTRSRFCLCFLVLHILWVLYTSQYTLLTLKFGRYLKIKKNADLEGKVSS